jgi:hypothetical protein
MMSLDSLVSSLKEIFGDRLEMVATFGGGTNTCAIVRNLTIDDLDRCAVRAPQWSKAGLLVPLLVVKDDLPRALDAFPLELAEILATRQIVWGEDLFASLNVATPDLRRACEVQARSHVLHLREAYIEAAGDAKAKETLVAAAIPPFRALVTNVARLDGVSPKALVTRLNLDNFEKGFPEALHAAERIVEYVDTWKH